MLRAVLIGINQYLDSRISGLDWACNDASELGTLLETRIRSDERDVRVILNSHATKRNVMAAIGDELARLEAADDIIIIYFACHGSPEYIGLSHSASRYLVMHDTNYDNLFASGIDMECDLVSLFSRLEKSKNILLVLDCCFSGLAGGRTFSGPSIERSRTAFRVETPLSLQRLELGEGRIMLCACRDDQVAREDALLKHGVFTYHFIRHLTESGRTEPTVSVAGLYEWLVRDLKNATGGRQVPVLNGRLIDMQLPHLGRNNSI
jgi:hypothetical protein